MKNCFREKGVEVHHTSTPNEGENQSPQEKKENTQTHTNSQTKQNHETNFQSSKALFGTRLSVYKDFSKTGTNSFEN
jgi:hypothetical protein